MKKPIQLSIPNPCHENWANMTPAEKGRFCAACQKTVRDFTQASDREIVEAVHSGSSACGRFRASQLNRELIVRKEKSPFWAAASAAAITFLTIGTGEVVAQTPVDTEQHENKTDDIKSDFANGRRVRPTSKVQGVVTDSQGLPIPGVIVRVKGSQTEVQTDFDGVYKIEAVEHERLEFSYVGMKTLEITVGSTPVCNATLADGDNITIGIIVYSPRRLRLSVASQYMFDY